MYTCAFLVEYTKGEEELCQCAWRAGRQPRWASRIDESCTHLAGTESCRKDGRKIRCATDTGGFESSSHFSLKCIKKSPLYDVYQTNLSFPHFYFNLLSLAFTFLPTRSKLQTRKFTKSWTDAMRKDSDPDQWPLKCSPLSIVD